MIDLDDIIMITSEGRHAGLSPSRSWEKGAGIKKGLCCLGHRVIPILMEVEDKCKTLTFPSKSPAAALGCSDPFDSHSLFHTDYKVWLMTW